MRKEYFCFFAFLLLLACFCLFVFLVDFFLFDITFFMKVCGNFYLKFSLCNFFSIYYFAAVEFNVIQNCILCKERIRKYQIILFCFERISKNYT